MDYKKWLDRNTWSLKGKKIAVTGATGGIGTELCKYLAYLGAELIVINRNQKKTDQLISDIRDEYQNTKILSILCDLEDVKSVYGVANELKTIQPDVLIHNAGAYSIPRYVTTLGVDNVFQINHVSPYILTRELLPVMEQYGGKIVIVGSIAHNYSKIDQNDFDFTSRTASSKVYGNAKRHLMLSMYELFEKTDKCSLSVVHPGITFTNITAHYPKLIFAIIKHPMKIIFMPPKKAALCIIKGVFEKCNYGEWIGPRVFNIWGLPVLSKLKTFSRSESCFAYNTAEKILNYFIKSVK